MKNTKLLFVLVLLITFFSCSVNKAKIDNSLKIYFDEAAVDGCFSMYNNATGEVTVYNMELDTQRFVPAGTFHIVASLAGLETGDITNDTMRIRWNQINPDTLVTMDMKTALRTNAYPYFQEVVRRIGKDTLQKMIDSLGYGTKTVEPLDSFWTNGALRVSPDEQVGMMKRLYFDQLPFRKSSHQMIKDAMVQEDNTNYKLSYISSIGTDTKNGHNIGWVTGWIEENKHVYFFTTFVKGEGSKVTDINKKVLKHLGFFEGKK